jgi:large subunit ribosomal protein L10
MEGSTLKRTEKQEQVANLKELLGKSGAAFLITFRGVKVTDETTLRRQVRNAGSVYRVVKNTLLTKAVENTDLAECFAGQLTGPTAIACTERDPVVLARTMIDFAKTNPSFVFKAAVVDGQPVPVGQIQELANLPPRKELIAKMLYLLKSPIVRLVNVLNSPAGRFVNVMHQVAGKAPEEAAKEAPKEAPASPE